MVPEAPWRLHQALRREGENRWAIAAWDAWDGALPDATWDAHLAALTAWDGDAEKLVSLAPDDPALDEILLPVAAQELCKRDVVRSAA